MAQYNLHLVSDSTGETTQGVVRACMAQFEGVDVDQHLWPMVRTAEALTNVINGIRGQPGVVIFTLVNETTRSALQDECRNLNLPCVSVIDPVIEAMARYFHREQSGRPGGQHLLNAEYFDRIEAMNFVLSHDDGQNAWSLEEADIVLVGVSRTSKTPTSIYLANHWGMKTANVPGRPGHRSSLRTVPAEEPFLCRAHGSFRAAGAGAPQPPSDAATGIAWRVRRY